MRLQHSPTTIRVLSERKWVRWIIHHLHRSMTYLSPKIVPCTFEVQFDTQEMQNVHQTSLIWLIKDKIAKLIVFDKSHKSIITYLATRAAFSCFHLCNEVESNLRTFSCRKSILAVVCRFWFLRYEIRRKPTQRLPIRMSLLRLMLAIDASMLACACSAFSFWHYFSKRWGSTTASMGRAVQWGRIGNILCWIEGLWRLCWGWIWCLGRQIVTYISSSDGLLGPSWEPEIGDASMQRLHVLLHGYVDSLQALSHTDLIYWHQWPEVLLVAIE